MKKGGKGLGQKYKVKTWRVSRSAHNKEKFREPTCGIQTQACARMHAHTYFYMLLHLFLKSGLLRDLKLIQGSVSIWLDY